MELWSSEVVSRIPFAVLSSCLASIRIFIICSVLDALRELLSIHGDLIWCTEIFSLFNEFFTSGPDALSLFAHLFSVLSDASVKVLLPSGFFWMAEVNCEEIFVSLEVGIVSNDLSFSPFAFIIAVSHVVIDARHDSGDVSGHVSWSAVITFWDQINTVRPDAWRSAVSLSLSIEATLPFTCGHGSSSSWFWWMAELFGKEWNWSSLIMSWWKYNVGIVHEIINLAWSSTHSSVIASLHACFKLLELLRNILW